ncbi:MAG: hypothetical protein AB2733_17080, partial [Candidatus Thiodiazotropha taylori]
IMFYQTQCGTQFFSLNCYRSPPAGQAEAGLLSNSIITAQTINYLVFKPSVSSNWGIEYQRRTIAIQINN